MKVSKQTSHNNQTSNKILIPIILMIGFIPLIVHMHQYNANLSQFDWFPSGADEQVDFFFAWKMIAIIIVGIVIAGILLYRGLKKKEQFRFENSFYFLMFYGLFVVMSALFSGYKYWVVRGSYELFEPVWVVLTYILLCYYTYHFVQNEKQVITIFSVAGIGMAIVALIGVFQFFKLDFFKCGFGKRLITNPSWWGSLDELNFNMQEGTSYTTLYNPNFLSFYFGMLIPLLLCIFIATKKVWQKILLVVAEVLCLVCLLGSGSDTGWMALAIGGVVLVLVLLSRRKKAFCLVLILVIVGGVVMVTVGTKTTIGSRIKDTIVGTFYMEDTVALQSMTLNDDNVELDIWGNLLYISYGVNDEGSIRVDCEDADGKLLETTLVDNDSQIYKIDDARFADVSVKSVSLGQENTPAVSVSIGGVEWQFVHVLDQGYYLCNAAGKLVKWDGVKRSHLFKEDAMSFRGHIWDMTIPLLGKHVFVGSGANTYMFEFPQDDYLFHAYYTGNAYDVKAHCWYLQQWIETGLLGTLALLIFIGWYVVRSVRIYRRVDLHESSSWIGFGLFAAVIVYLLAAIVNDSNVCTAPVFWCVLGLGLAVNRMLVEKNGLFVRTVTQQSKNTDVQKINLDSNGADSAKANKEEATVVVKKATSAKKQSRKQRKNQKK